MALVVTSPAKPLIKDIKAGVETSKATAAERNRRKKEKIDKLKEKKALLKHKALKYKLIAQRCG
jgi:hypothetical protein